MKNRLYIVFAVLIGLATACEQEVELDIPESEQQYVVEGYIEQDLPPFVILTKTTPYFSPLTLASLEESFVHGAVITVNNGNYTDTLTEFSSDTLAVLIKALEDSLNIDINLIDLLGGEAAALITKDFKFYVYTTVGMFGEVQKKYDLKIQIGESSLSASTTIPLPIPVDSLWVTPHPSPEYSNLVLLNGRFSDPAGQDNFVRYFTQRNRGVFSPGYFQSVFDDHSLVDLDGQTFNFTLERGYTFIDDIDFKTFSYFERGDTIRLRWSMIDEAHYDFWSSVEFDRSQTGNPFGRPALVKSNIKGGLGIWGGYGSSYHQLITE